MKITPEIVVLAEERALKLIQSANSASAQYQQYVQSMSDCKDTLDAFSSAHLMWVSMMIECHKVWLDSYKNMLASDMAGGMVQQMIDASAKHLLLTGRAA